jgi:hypothetical protein
MVNDMKTPTLRFLLPTLLLFIAISQIRIGGNALPIWISTLSLKNDLNPSGVLKIMIAIELCLATIFYFYGPKVIRLAQACLAVVVFVALAECSASIKRGLPTSIATSATVALISIVFLVVISKVHSKSKDDAPRHSRQRASGLGIFACIVVCLTGIAIPLNTSLPPRTISDGAIMARDLPTESGGSRIIEMNPMQWVGRSILETPIGQFTPDAVGQLGEKGILILYNPRCGTCHDMFDVHFSEGADLPIVAIDVPPTEEAVLLESEYDEQVDCASCTFMSLPKGPLWLVSVPFVMVVENGVVTCVSKDGPGECL